jgi:hypothetical protein
MFFKNIKKHILKQAQQKAIQLQVEEDVFDLKHSLARIISPRIKYFRQISSSSHPSELTKEEWELILLRMEKSFEWFSKEENLTSAEEENFHLEGIGFFARYYKFLWHSNE